uniref:Ig-like domain-containing protein n=1 Tax=Myripristis murdjan TaxID=586833 RepID=A0A667YEH3_9TELE
VSPFRQHNYHQGEDGQKRQQVRASVSQSLWLPCTGQGNPQPTIHWVLYDGAVVKSNRPVFDSRVSVYENGTLHLKDVTSADNGKYECIATSSTGSERRVLDNGTLIVHSINDKDAGDYLCVARSKIGDDLQLMKVSVSMKPAKIEPKVYNKKQVHYGNDLKVDCKASGAPQPEISWALPDGTMIQCIIIPYEYEKKFQKFHMNLMSLQVGMSEEGKYTCYAENQMGKDEMHVHITVVTASPRIRSPSQTYAKVKPGGNIRFDCEAVGEPKPKILWMLPSNDIIAASNERYLMHVNGSLDIRDVKLIDAGEYVCMARNNAGENRKVYKLDIDGNPPVINGYHQNRTVIKDTAAKYSRKLIDCKAEGDPAPTKNFPFNHFPNADVVMTVICVIKYFKNTSSALKVKIGLLKNIYTEACFTLDRHLHEQ